MAKRSDYPAEMAISALGGRLSARQKLLDAQGGKCPVCGDVLKNGHLDHDHRTGQLRGLLCKGCNIGLGFLRDDPATLRRAADYCEQGGARTTDQAYAAAVLVGYEETERLYPKAFAHFKLDDIMSKLRRMASGRESDAPQV